MLAGGGALRSMSIGKEEPPVKEEETPVKEEEPPMKEEEPPVKEEDLGLVPLRLVGGGLSLGTTVFFF